MDRQREEEEEYRATWNCWPDLTRIDFQMVEIVVIWLVRDTAPSIKLTALGYWYVCNTRKEMLVFEWVLVNDAVHWKEQQTKWKDISAHNSIRVYEDIGKKILFSSFD